MKNKDDDTTAESNGRSIMATVVEKALPAEAEETEFRLPRPSLHKEVLAEQLGPRPTKTA
jgi:hypothetical protein